MNPDGGNVSPDEQHQQFLHTVLSSLQHYERFVSVNRDPAITYECELRFHSWRAPSSVRPNSEESVGWDRRMSHDEMVRVMQRLQSLGWEPSGPTSTLTRCRDKENTHRRLDEQGRLVEKVRLNNTAFQSTRRVDEFVSTFHAGFELSSETLVNTPVGEVSKDRYDQRTLQRLQLRHPRFPWARVDASEWVETHTFELEVEVEEVLGMALTTIAAQLWELYLHIIAALQQTFAPMLGPLWSRLQFRWITELLPKICFPQTVSIHMGHLEAIFRGEFALTQKIDGSRQQLWLVDSQVLRVEIVGDHCNLAHTGWRFGTDELPATSLLADAECVLSEGDEHTPASFHIHVFDLLYYQGEVIDWPLIQRMQTFQQWLQQVSALEPLPIGCTIQCKPYVIFPQDPEMVFESRQFHFFRLLSQFIDQDYPIGPHVDGYIFTSLSQPLPVVQGTHRGVMMRRWAGTVKWKPIDRTTIDFQLGDFDESTRRCALLVWQGGKPKPFETTMAEANWLQFPVNHHCTADRMWWMEDLVELELRPGQIVECGWSLTRQQWTPIRVRGDKQTPNSLDVAHANWHLIQYPVPIPRSVSEAAEYIRQYANAYYDEGKSQQDEGYHQVSLFHNMIKQRFIQWMADTLRGMFSGVSLYVLDFAFGRGGDILKYIRTMMGMVLGLDIHAANLKYAESRLRSLSAVEPLSTTFHLLELNVGESWQPKRGDPPKYLYSTDEQEVVSAHVMDKLLHCGRPMFHIGTMLFALHFLWSSQELFDTWVAHVNDTIRVDGYLFITCFDGEKVYDYFRRKESMEYYTKNNEKWISIQPVYDRSTPYTAEHPFGFGLDVYMHSVHQQLTHREYLVHPKVLREQLEKYGFREIAGPIPQTYFADMEWCKEYKIPFGLMNTLELWNRVFLFQRIAHVR